METIDKLSLIKELANPDSRQARRAWATLFEMDREMIRRKFAIKYGLWNDPGNTNLDWLVDRVDWRFDRKLRNGSLDPMNLVGYHAYLKKVRKSAWQDYCDRTLQSRTAYSIDFIGDGNHGVQLDNPSIGQFAFEGTRSPEWILSQRDDAEILALTATRVRMLLHHESQLEKVLPFMLAKTGNFTMAQASMLMGIGRATAFRYTKKKLATLREAGAGYKSQLSYPIFAGNGNVETSAADIPVYESQGWSWITSKLDNLHPDTEATLVRASGAKSIERFWGHYEAVLVVLQDARGIRPILSFLDRRNLGPRLWRNGALHYLSGTPIFSSERGTGDVLHRIVIPDLSSIEAWIDDMREDEDGNIVKVEWIYDIPGGRLRLLKPFDHSVFNPELNHPRGISFLHKYESSDPHLLVDAYHHGKS